jgi:hypothetical protein
MEIQRMHESLSHRIDESICMVAEINRSRALLQLAIDNPDHCQLLIESYLVQVEGSLDVLAGNLKHLAREAVAENSSGL